MGALSPLYFSPEKMSPIREVPMVSRTYAPVPIMLAGLNIDRMNQAKHWADRREMDWYRPR